MTNQSRDVSTTRLAGRSCWPSPHRRAIRSPSAASATSFSTASEQRRTIFGRPRCTRPAADAGDDIAAFNLGVLSGRSPHAVHWLRRAAEAGITEAYPLLGDRLSDRDLDEEALQWYVRGAEAGDKGSMYAAACWYRDGFGGPVNLVQALRWYLAMLDVAAETAYTKHTRSCRG